MAVLEILHYPDSRLRNKAQPVKHVDDNLRRQVEDMYETLYESQGVGLAATQVDIHLRLFVIDVSETRDQRQCVINPEIISKEGTQYELEGCLSATGAYDRVERALKVRVRGTDLDGNVLEFDAEGLKAACVQHEMDHLNGILFVDHLSRLKQERYRKKVSKLMAVKE